MSEKDDYRRLDGMVEEESKSSRGEIFCPECGSPRLYYLLGFRLGQIYVCKDCGYQGSVVIEDGEIADKIREDWLEKKVS